MPKIWIWSCQSCPPAKRNIICKDEWVDRTKRRKRLQFKAKGPQLLPNLIVCWCAGFPQHIDARCSRTTWHTAWPKSMLAASLCFSGGPGLFAMPPAASCKRIIYFHKKTSTSRHLEKWKQLGFVLQIPNQGTSPCVSTRSTHTQGPTCQEGTLRDFKGDTRTFTLLSILVLRLYYTSSICASPWLVCSGPRCSISTLGSPRRKVLFPSEDRDISTRLDEEARGERLYLVYVLQQSTFENQ